MTVTFCCVQSWIATRNSILHACHFEGTRELNACEYQVAFDLYHNDMISMVFQVFVVIEFIHEVNWHFYHKAYHKQQKLSRRKLSWFLWIFDELKKFFLLIDRCHVVESKIAKVFSTFSQILLNREAFLLLNFCCLWYVPSTEKIEAEIESEIGEDINGKKEG